ncbi:MAG: hypothetical protein M3460_05775 [Actinomycetota bacterium]|nr:hypothetical protein [Actinomycetota bacterium]
MTSLIGPKGDTGHRPTTTRCPVVVPKAAISPSKRQRKAATDRFVRRVLNSYHRLVGAIFPNVPLQT